MKKLVLIAILLTPVSRYTVGNSNWCGVDSIGNLSCFFYSYDYCMQQVARGSYETCVPNPQ